MGSMEKRKKIDQLCDRLYDSVSLEGCKNCPLSNNESSWCRMGQVSDIPDDLLDEILKEMEECL